MSVGIFGGTFDPVHLGHLRAAEEIREQFRLDKVYFVPAYIPPHKRTHKITDPATRLRMLKAAIRGNKFLRASEIEIKSGGVSYSINTIRMFEKRFEQIYFIMGIDAFLEIDTWYNYRELFDHTDFIVMGRPINEKKEPKGLFPGDIGKEIRRLDGNTFEHRSGKKIHVQHVTQLDISSTEIRKSVGNGRSIKYLVPGQVERIIEEERLYKNR
jgi:nicotinate-nucleotide adenylyltransferase